MQMILNELSAKFPIKSIEKARELMDTFLETYFSVKKIIRNDSVLLDQDYKSFELASGYRIEQWRNDPNVDIESKRRFRVLLDKSDVYNSEEFEQETGWDFRTEFRHEDCTSKGGLLVYETDGVAISFLNDEHWKIAVIRGNYIELAEDGELYESQVEIPNVSFDGNVEIFREFYTKKYADKQYSDIISGESILKCADKVFPNLVFCESATLGCRKNVGVSEAKQVYKRLSELQRTAEMMENGFDKNVLTKATPESEATLERFKAEHTFRLPNGKTETFSWHTRYTGGYAGRIFFSPAPKERVIYIGHIGHKLPTVKYH